MNMEASNWNLSRWSRLIRLRDKGICFMCGKKSGIFQMNAHHIYPKGDPRYKDKILNLDNGITLCFACHRNVVHSSWTNWRKFCIMFRQYMKRKEIKEFNTRELE